MTNLKHHLTKKQLIITPQGDWMSRTAKMCETACEKIKDTASEIDEIILDLNEVTRLDTTGVWILEKTLQFFKSHNKTIRYQGHSDTFINLQKKFSSPQKLSEIPSSSLLISYIQNIGQATHNLFILSYELLTFLGEVTCTLLRILFNPSHWRMTALIAQIEKVGINAIPIISLMSMSLAMVLSYQGQDQLKRFGAEIYTINLVSISIVREVGILITAILVAGRSGSAITAELGIMKINQEIDALLTLGLKPLEVLVIPRILALTIILPFLAFIADIAGLIGGGLMVMTSMDISPVLYIQHMREAITEWGFWIGIMKAPFFGFMIGLVSCFEGLQVHGTAESVGYRTTRSVVESIFLVTILDALFSIFFSKIGI